MSTGKEFLRFLLKRLLALLREEDGLPSLGLNQEALAAFPFPDELPVILSTAQRFFGDDPSLYPVNPFALLLAIRCAERGRKGFEFGVVAVKDTDLATQTEWACATIKKNFERFRESKERDFITFLWKRYAPPGAENDPRGLNYHWEKNVRFFYERFKEVS